MERYLIGLVVAFSLSACAPQASITERAVKPENTITMVGGKVLEITGPLAFRVDSDLSPLGQDSSERIEVGSEALFGRGRSAVVT